MLALIGLAMAATGTASWLLARWAVRNAAALGFVALPNAINAHHEPVPLLGGAAVFAAAAPAILLASAADRGLLGLAPALLVALALGLWKDRVGRTIPIALQLAWQCAASLCLWMGGLGFETGGGPAFDAIVTVLFVILLINAVNFVDVQDMLAGGNMLVALTAFGIIALLNAEPVVAVLAFLLGASLCGFLAHNAPPARIFMGDAGSFGLGLVLAALILRFATGAGVSAGWAVLLPAIFPLAELLFTVGARLSAGRSPFIGDGMHLSSVLRRSGWSERWILAMTYSITLLSCVVAIESTTGRGLAELSALEFRG